MDNNLYNIKKSEYVLEQVSLLRQALAPPILILQMGSVGSKTIFFSLCDQPDLVLEHVPVFHMHFLSEDRMTSFEKQNSHLVDTEKVKRLQHCWQAQCIRKELLSAPRSKGKWRVISLVRDPIARNASDFFKHTSIKKMPDKSCAFLSSKKYNFNFRFSGGEAPGEELVDQLIDIFIDRYDHLSCTRYFDNELFSEFGVDVYDSKFYPSNGYSICDYDPFSLLLLRTQDIDRVAKEATEKFLGVSSTHFSKRNARINSPQGSIYKMFISRLRVPGHIAHNIYQSRFARHFFSTTEINSFAERWTHV